MICSRLDEFATISTMTTSSPQDSGKPAQQTKTVHPTRLQRWQFAVMGRMQAAAERGRRKRIATKPS